MTETIKLIDKRFHQFSHKALSSVAVSTKSKWTDSAWYLDPVSKGAHLGTTSIIWSTINVGEPRPKADRYWTDLGKRLTWSLLTERGQGRGSASVNTAVAKAGSFIKLAQWAIAEGLEDLAALDDRMARRYCADVIKSRPADMMSHQTLWRRISILDTLWQQRKAIQTAGFSAMPCAPWGGRSARDIASGVVEEAINMIPPLPDEVSIRIMNAAARLLDPVIVSDVLSLRDLYFEHMERVQHYHPVYRMQLIGQALGNFKFGEVKGEKKPWHPRLNRSRHFRPHARSGARGIVGKIRALIDYLSTAAIITIQGTTGMRSSEICGLLSDKVRGPDPFIRYEQAPSLHFEYVTIDTYVSKKHSAPVMMPFVCGVRISGTNTVPIPIQAVGVLEALWKPWRGPHCGDALILQFSRTSGLPDKASTGVQTLKTLKSDAHMKAFIRDWVDYSDLPDESADPWMAKDLIPYKKAEGSNFRAHQLRKTFASFMARADENMLPAISIHFKHSSVAMTDWYYTKDTTGLRKHLLNVEERAAASVLTSFFYGEKLGGRMSEQLEDRRREIAAIAGDGDKFEVKLRILRYVETVGLRLFEAEHGKCLPLNPGKMRCHIEAGTVHPFNKEPNYDSRTPRTCMGCGCFLFDESHIPYWKKRYVEFWTAVGTLESNGITAGHHIVKERAKTCTKLLTRLNVATADLDAQVGARLKDTLL